MRRETGKRCGENVYAPSSFSPPMATIRPCPDQAATAGTGDPADGACSGTTASQLGFMN